MQPPHGYSVPPTYLQQFAAAQAQSEQLRRFWAEMIEEAQRTGTDPLEFKTQQLPLARIKKVSLDEMSSRHLRLVHCRLHSDGLCALSVPSLCTVQIMKSDEDVRMISAEAPVLFAKVRGGLILSLQGSIRAGQAHAGAWPLTPLSVLG